MVLTLAGRSIADAEKVNLKQPIPRRVYASLIEGTGGPISLKLAQYRWVANSIVLDKKEGLCQYYRQNVIICEG